MREKRFCIHGIIVEECTEISAELHLTGIVASIVVVERIKFLTCHHAGKFINEIF